MNTRPEEDKEEEEPEEVTEEEKSDDKKDEDSEKKSAPKEKLPDFEDEEGKGKPVAVVQPSSQPTSNVGTEQ